MRAPAATFRREDYPDLQTEDQRDRFFRQLNTFCKQTQSALSGGLTLGENSSAFLKTVTFTANDWTPVAYQNSWTDVGAPYAPVAYMKDSSGRVWLRGVAAAGTLNTVLFTLPAGFRPASTVAVGVGYWTGAAVTSANIAIASDGTATGAGMTGTSGYDVKLDGISFQASGGSSLCPAISFRNTLPSRPAGVLTLGARDVTDRNASSVALGDIAWDSTADQVLVSDIAGLQPTRKYQISLLVIGG